jgi:transmembrane sensor
MTSESTRGSAASDEQWEALARYLAGESSAEEAAQVGRWLAADPRRRELLDALRRSTDTLALTARSDVDVEAALGRVSARFDDAPAHAIDARRARRSVSPAVLARAAAMAAVLLGAAAIVWQATRDNPMANSAATVDRTFTAPVGGVDSVRLADGTRVMLAPGSTVTVKDGFGTSTHDVALVGEALFDVASASAGRFTVHAGNAIIRDLGTTFAVRSDPVAVRVVVTAGSVVLSVAAAADSGTVLRAGDRALLPRGGTVNTQRGTTSSDDLAWTDGRLVFDSATLAQVADDVHRWYGIRLQFADSALAARHFTARFAGEDVQHVLAVLALALDVDIQRTGDTVRVSRKRMND